MPLSSVDALIRALSAALAGFTGANLLEPIDWLNGNYQGIQGLLKEPIVPKPGNKISLRGKDRENRAILTPPSP